jgi:hypothetical protein
MHVSIFYLLAIRDDDGQVDGNEEDTVVGLESRCASQTGKEIRSVHYGRY